MYGWVSDTVRGVYETDRRDGLQVLGDFGKEESGEDST